MDFPLGLPWESECWPKVSFQQDALLKHETFDDEGAEQVFVGRDWSGVEKQVLIEHPTSIWFLRDEVFWRMLPIMMTSLYQACVKISPRDEDSDIGFAGDFMDSFFTNLDRRSDSLTKSLTVEQRSSINEFCAAISQLTVPGLQYGIEVLSKLRDEDTSQDRSRA